MTDETESDLLLCYRQKANEMLLELDELTKGCSDTWLRLRAPMYARLRQRCHPATDVATSLKRWPSVPTSEPQLADSRYPSFAGNRHAALQSGD